jgi:hypothetical protein
MRPLPGPVYGRGERTVLVAETIMNRTMRRAVGAHKKEQPVGDCGHQRAQSKGTSK